MGIWEGGKKRQRETNHETPYNREQTEAWWREVVREWARWAMGAKKGTCDEPCYICNESLNSTPENNIILYTLEFK